MTSSEDAGGHDQVFEIGSVEVTLEKRPLRSRLRIGDIELKSPPVQRGAARRLVQLAGGRET